MIDTVQGGAASAHDFIPWYYRGRFFPETFDEMGPWYKYDPAQAKQALELGSCQIINIKIGRVGGYSQALAIHDLCYSKNVPVWCGGMLESGIGRAHNIALASLPGFSLPGDISASSRYFARDVIVPEVEVAGDGTVEVPQRPGLGFEVDLDYITSKTQTLERVEGEGQGMS